MGKSCTICRKSPPEVTLKRCAKCSVTPYCSRDCQKADWKTHKKVCGKGDSTAPGSSSNPDPPVAGAELSPPRGLDKPIAKPFSRLDSGTWLHDRPEKDVYRLLIDAYRLRVDDSYKFDGEIDDNSLYGGATNGLKGFRRFLRLAGARSGILPPWWNAEKQRECEELGMDASQFQNLYNAVEKSDIIEHYGDSLFPMQLRMFAEAIYGRGPGGQDGTMMRKMMAAGEQGSGFPYMTNIDATTGASTNVRSGGRR